MGLEKMRTLLSLLFCVRFDYATCDNQVVQLVAIMIDSFERAEIKGENDPLSMDLYGRKYYQDWIKAYADSAIAQYGNYLVLDKLLRKYFPDMNGPNKFTYFGIYRNKNVHLQNRIDDIFSQMTPVERKIASEQFAQIVECADYKMRNNSMAEWELWSDKYHETTKATQEPLPPGVPNIAIEPTMVNLKQFRMEILEINEEKKLNKTECHLCDRDCGFLKKTISLILLILLLI